MWRTRFFVGALVCVVLALTMGANAALIWVDEDFDQGTVFADKGFPIRANGTSLTAQSQIDGDQGLNVEYLDGNATRSASLPVFTNTGVTTTARFFTAPNSLQLTGTAKVSAAMASGSAGGTTDSYPYRGNDKTYQFVVAVSTATLAGVPTGTQIGHFKIDYSTDTTTGQGVDKTFQLNFVKTADNRAEIQYNGSAVAGMPGYPGWWSVVTILVRQGCTSQGVANTANWGAFDYVHVPGNHPELAGNPLTKGPQDMYQATQTTSSQVLSGFTVFVNSNQPSLYVSPTAFDSNPDFSLRWGNSATAWRAGSYQQRTAEVGWELAADNGGTLFVDDMFWWTALCANDARGALTANGAWSYNNGAARLVPFVSYPGGALEELPQYPLPAAAKNWSLY